MSCVNRWKKVSFEQEWWAPGFEPMGLIYNQNIKYQKKFEREVTGILRIYFLYLVISVNSVHKLL